MLRSLVGSEMCIRDSLFSASETTLGAPVADSESLQQGAGPRDGEETVAEAAGMVMPSVSSKAESRSAVATVSEEEAGGAGATNTACMHGRMDEWMHVPLTDCLDGWQDG